MKIAIATDDYLNVTGHVGRCAGFLVYEVENGEIIKEEKRENSFTNHGKGKEKEHGHHNHEHGKNGHARLAEGLNDCSHLICHGAGWRLVDDLKSENIQLVLTKEIIAKNAAIKLEQGELITDESLKCHSH